jgi:anti-anti-sigma factor
MEIVKEIEGSKLIIRLKGEMHTPEASDFQKVFKSAVEEMQNINDITLDMTELDYIVSAGLRVLLEMARYMNGKGTVHTIGANDRVTETIDMTGIGQYLNMM